MLAKIDPVRKTCTPTDPPAYTTSVTGLCRAPQLDCSFRCRIHSLLLIVLVAFSLSCKAATAEYDAVFSGLVISTQRIAETANQAANPDVAGARDLRFWTKSKILVLHIWRGVPPAVVEVWAPGGSSCDRTIIAGLHFVALARSENGRLIARNSDCEGDAITAATQGPGAYTNAAVSMIAAAFLVTALALAWSAISIRRLRRSRTNSQRLPIVLCFVAAVLPVCPAIYLIGFQSVITALTILVVLLFWSKLLAHLSTLEARKRNAGWLLASALAVVGIAMLPIKFDSGFGEMRLIGSPGTTDFWITVAVAVVLTMLLLNALRGIHRQIRR